MISIPKEERSSLNLLVRGRNCDADCGEGITHLQPESDRFSMKKHGKEEHGGRRSVSGSMCRTAESPDSTLR